MADTMGTKEASEKWGIANRKSASGAEMVLYQVHRNSKKAVHGKFQ